MPDWLLSQDACRAALRESLAAGRALSGSDSDGSGTGQSETVGEAAPRFRELGRQAVAWREEMFSGVPVEERRRQQELVYGSSFVAQLRRADDWAVEAMLRLGVGDDDDGDSRRAVFCAQAAQMTDSCHGTLWPHLKFETQKHRADENFTLMLGLITENEALGDELENANRALGIDAAWEAKPPRETGSCDLGVLQQVPAPTSANVAGLKGCLLADGVPSFVCVERLDSMAALALRLGPAARRDASGATLVEVAFMHNTPESIRKPGNLEILTLEALTEELGTPRKVTCDGAELEELLRELCSNSAQLSVACHMRHRETFACGATGEEAVRNRVMREPLEVSFLRMLEPPSRMMESVLDAKARGNAKFTAGELAEALRYYEQALLLIKDCDSRETCAARLEESKVHANRSECFLRQRSWTAAADAATAALVADPRNAKALFRRAKARQELGDQAAAVADVKSVVRIEPRNQQARALLRDLCPADTSPTSAQQFHVGARSADLGEAGVALPAPSAWARGLSPAMQHEWLVDCYRMRVDDDYAWGGGELRGLYAAATGGGGSIWKDFLVFCKLAVRRQAIPHEWDWCRFLATAEGLLRYAFEKSDAQKKYGSENVFAAATGGRSLRYTAEVIYGSSISAMADSDEADQLEEEMHGHRGPDEAFFEDVGGAAVWHESGLLPRRPGGGRGGAATTPGTRIVQECRYFQLGNCRFGDRCRYLHEAGRVVGGRGSVQPCRHWQRGRCAFGESCRFSHG